MAYNYSKQEAKSFGQIILGHYEQILQLSRTGLRVAEKIMIMAGEKAFIEKEDTRLSYIIGIENLAYALFPYFDKGMKTYFDTNIIFLNGFSYEIEEAIEDKKFKELLNTKTGVNKEDLLIAFQIKIAKAFFIELGALMKRVDYLKASVFGDASSDDIIEDDAEDSE